MGVAYSQEITAMIDWTDDTLRTLDDLAATAFSSESGVTKDTLKRRIRQGKLIAYQPGKQFLSTYVNVRAMLECVRIKREPRTGLKAPRSDPPDPLGRTPSQVASAALDYALEQLDRQRKAQKEEQRRRRQLELARTEPERRRQRLEERRAKARAKYLEKKKAALALKLGEH
jgi:hypothetical protein